MPPNSTLLTHDDTAVIINENDRNSVSVYGIALKFNKPTVLCGMF